MRKFGVVEVCVEAEYVISLTRLACVSLPVSDSCTSPYVLCVCWFDSGRVMRGLCVGDVGNVGDGAGYCVTQ